MSFSDLMKKPLPSKTVKENNVVESVEAEVDALISSITVESADELKDFDNAIKEMDVSLTKEDSDDNVVDTDDKDDDDKDEDDDKDDDKDDDDNKDEDAKIDSLDDIDLSSLSDAELDEMESDLRDSDIDDVVGEVDPVELTADEEREADDLMSLAGTTELLKAELSADERASFLESATETQIAVFEGFLLESDILPASNDGEDSVMTEAKLYNKTTIRFSKEDRKAQLYAVALNVSARAHNDPDFIKLQRVQKIRRILKKRIQRKYHSEAIRRMRVYFNRLRSSKSNILSSLAKKIVGDKD